MDLSRARGFLLQPPSEVDPELRVAMDHRLAAQLSTITARAWRNLPLDSGRAPVPGSGRARRYSELADVRDRLGESGVVDSHATQSSRGAIELNSSHL